MAGSYRSTKYIMMLPYFDHYWLPLAPVQAENPDYDYLPLDVMQVKPC